MSERGLSAEDIPEALHREIGPIQFRAATRQGITSVSGVFSCRHGEVFIKRYRKHYLAWGRREGVTLRALAESGRPIPKLRCSLERDFDGESEVWIAMDNLQGERISDVLQGGKVDGKDRCQLFSACGRVMRSIHDISVPPFLSGVGEDWLQRIMAIAAAYQNVYAKEHANDDYTRVSGERRKRLDDMGKKLPTPHPSKFIHGDFSTDHVLMVGDKVAGVVDWATATVGDPRYDMAQALFLPGMESSQEFKMTDDVRAFFDGYGINPVDVEELRYFQDLYDLGGFGCCLE